MSTLTSSPSPVPSHSPSPRSAFYVHHTSTYSPRYYTSSPSPRQQPLFSYGSRQRKEQSKAVPEAREKEQSRYVDAGTQYSPDGYPPTTARGGTGAEQKEEEAEKVSTRELAGGKQDHKLGEKGRREQALKKRKERTSPEPMSTSTSSSAGSSLQSGRPPPEPEPRRDPTPATSTAQSSGAVAGPSTRATHALSTASTAKRARAEAGATKLMPVLYQDCNPKDLGTLISLMLLELIRLNDTIPLHNSTLTRFHSRSAPSISVPSYLERLIHHATLSPPLLLTMVYYIDLLCSAYPAFTINSLTVHRFLITAACVAAKGLSDSFWTNPTYAKIGGISTGELATLELEFLDKVGWRIVPRNEVLGEYYRSLVERTEGFEMEEGEKSAVPEDGPDDRGEGIT